MVKIKFGDCIGIFDLQNPLFCDLKFNYFWILFFEHQCISKALSKQSEVICAKQSSLYNIMQISSPKMG